MGKKEVFIAVLPRTLKVWYMNQGFQESSNAISCLSSHAMKCGPSSRYGLGQIYYRQEKYEMAAYHFDGGLKVLFFDNYKGL